MIEMRRLFKLKETKPVENRKVALVTYTNKTSVSAEQFRSLRTNIEFVQLEKDLKSILVTSTLPSEGKSTVAANLATVMGQIGKKVLVVESDLRKPTLHKTFRLNRDRGLTTLLLDPTLQVEDVVQYREELNVYFLTAGTLPPNPSELLGSAGMQHLIKQLNDKFDLIIYDTPPLQTVTDAQILASKVDGVILVNRYGYANKEDVRLGIESLTKLKVDIIGYVMTRLPKTNNKKYIDYFQEE